MRSIVTWLRLWRRWLQNKSTCWEIYAAVGANALVSGSNQWWSIAHKRWTKRYRQHKTRARLGGCKQEVIIVCALFFDSFDLGRSCDQSISFNLVQDGCEFAVDDTVLEKLRFTGVTGECSSSDFSGNHLRRCLLQVKLRSKRKSFVFVSFLLFKCCLSYW